MKKSEAAANLIDYIDAQILAGVYPPGTKLPSMRTLARKFNVSYNTALRGIDYLVARGQLRKSPQSGVYVKSALLAEQSGDGGDRCIAVFTPHPQSGFSSAVPGIFHAALSTIHNLTRSYNYSLLLIPQSNGPLDAELVERINRQCSGVILMKELDAYVDELPFTVPTVGLLLAGDFGGRVSIVDIDPFNAADQAVAFFRERGLRRLKLIQFDYPCYRMRAAIMAQKWRDAGGNISEVISFRVGEPPVLPPLDPECGYFFTSDNLLYSCIETSRDAGIPLLREVAALAVDGKSLLMPWNLRFPTIAADWRSIGRIAFGECLARIENPSHSARRILLPGRLVNRYPVSASRS